MSKAFDKVSQTRLLSRLRDFGFGGNFLKWFSSYLENRYQQTVAFVVTSQPLLVTSGVPQGSILGPMLFLLYENDLTSAVTNSNIAMFADDTKLFREIGSVTDANQLHKDLLNFQTSSSNAGLQLNTSKCKSMQITRKHHPINFTYKLKCANGETAVRKRKMNVTLAYGSRANSAGESTYLNSVCVPTECLAALRDRLITSRVLQYGESLVRSQLGYASQVWAAQSIELTLRDQDESKEEHQNTFLTCLSSPTQHTVIASINFN